MNSETLQKAANPILFIAFISAFALLSLAEIIFSLLELRKPRSIAKPFPLLFLALAFFFYNHSFFPVALLFLFSALGDVLMLFKDRDLVIIGALSFFLSHLTSIIFLWRIYGIEGRALLSFLILLLSFVGLYLGGIGRKVSKSKVKSVAGAIYFATMLLRLVTYIIMGVLLSKWLFVSCAGLLLFFVSDALIVIHQGVRKIPRRDFFVMLTYLLAQALIGLGYFLCLA